MIHNPDNFLYTRSKLETFVFALAPSAAPSGIKLLDISEYQSREIVKYFPELIADGYGGIIVRATDGMIKDKNFDYFYPAILDAGMTIQVYGAMYANRSGTDQAKFLVDTVLPLLDAVDGNLVAWNDGETQDNVSVQKHRDELLKWLAEASRTFRKVGAYGSIKTWSEIYGNLVLPAQYYFWNAQWRSGTVYTLPAGIKASQLVFWQNGVWPKYAWGEQPDNLPATEDVDLNVMPGKTMQDLRDFTGQLEVTPPPPPPIPVPPHTHPELDAKIAEVSSTLSELKTSIKSLADEMNKLKDAVENFKANIPFVYFVPNGGSCVVQHATKWYKTSTGIDKPMFAPVGSGTHPKITGKVKVFPLPVTGDGGQVCFMLLDQLPDTSEAYYVRRQDGEIKSSV